jgi:hypothetical protein
LRTIKRRGFIPAFFALRSQELFAKRDPANPEIAVPHFLDIILVSINQLIFIFFPGIARVFRIGRPAQIAFQFLVGFQNIGQIIISLLVILIGNGVLADFHMAFLADMSGQRFSRFRGCDSCDPEKYYRGGASAADSISTIAGFGEGR